MQRPKVARLAVQDCGAECPAARRDWAAVSAEHASAKMGESRLLYAGGLMGSCLENVPEVGGSPCLVMQGFVSQGI